MNISFEVALQLINLGSYDKAVERLNEAIAQETENKNESAATEYRCVLAELLANLGRKDEANEEFVKVVSYCIKTGSLPKQREIAEGYLSKVSVKKTDSPKKTTVKKTVKKSDTEKKTSGAKKTETKKAETKKTAAKKPAATEKKTVNKTAKEKK